MYMSEEIASRQAQQPNTMSLPVSDILLGGMLAVTPVLLLLFVASLSSSKSVVSYFKADSDCSGKPSVSQCFPTASVSRLAFHLLPLRLIEHAAIR